MSPATGGDWSDSVRAVTRILVLASFPLDAEQLALRAKQLDAGTGRQAPRIIVED